MGLSRPLLVRLACVLSLATLGAATAVGQQAPARTRPWTILVYGAVDNSADEPLIEFLDKVRRAIDNDPGIELLLLIDRSDAPKTRRTYLGGGFDGTRLYRLTKDSAERLSGGSQLPEITLDKDVELNSADARYVQQFIAWGKANYPAKRYGLLIYSHADGHAMCPDEQSGQEMGFAELTDKVGVEERVDFMGLELCNMGGIEIAYQWRPGNGRFETDVLLAIPNAGPPLDWDRAFSRIRSTGQSAGDRPTLNPATMTAADFGKLIIDEGYLGRQMAERLGRRSAHESAGCYDLHHVAAVKKAVDGLSAELAKADVRDIIQELRGKPSKGGAIVYEPDGTSVDLYDLCERITRCDRLPKSARQSAHDVRTALEKLMLASFGMSAYQGFKGGKNGVYIVLPSDKQRFSRQLSWYTPLNGADKALGRLSFLRDGATPGNGRVENWFELLSEWFGEPSGRVGSTNTRP